MPLSDELLVTGYEAPDLDGVACSIAYAELLNKTSTKAFAALFGPIHVEADFILRRFNITQPPEASGLLKPDTHVILVDASELHLLPKRLKPEQVVEIVDHRKVHDADQFPNARVQIELVGSRATLISEKFFQAKLAPSPESAALLYAAILSNTVNFKATGVTTSRDHEAAQKLRNRFNCPPNLADEMFEVKSRTRARTWKQPSRPTWPCPRSQASASQSPNSK